MSRFWSARLSGRGDGAIDGRWMAEDVTVADLIAAIERFIAAWNDRCRPFTWTKDPDTVIAKATDPRHHKTSTASVTEH